jgi:hypothetical protein
MTLTLTDAPQAPRAKAPAKRGTMWRFDGEPVEAVVIDERRRPVERVPGAAPLKITGSELAMRSDVPLLPGSHVLLQIGPRWARDAARKQLELEVVGCKKRQGGHRVLTRIVEGAAAEMSKAA